MKGSGKQILLKILSDLSTRVISDAGLDEATCRVRAGLLLHGSTAEESYEKASRIVWATARDRLGELNRQGMALASGPVFISDLCETVFSMPGLKEHVLEEHPQLSEQDYEAFEWVLWLLVSSVQMFASLNAVEMTEEIDVNRWVEDMMRHYRNHFEHRGGKGSS